jgi:uncharacterized membrane protein YidH (DUF202 family)
MSPDISKEYAVETYKSLIHISVEGMKLIAVLNGGAAVALLAYLGSVASKGSAVPDMRWPMALFIFGLLLCGLAFLFSYLTQLRLYDVSIHQAQTLTGRSWSFWLHLAIVCVILSLLLFASGGLVAVWRFQ